MLLNGTYRSGEYKSIIIHDPKEREVFDIPFYPHRIVHWALIDAIRPVLMNSIGPHSFAAMKGRGAHQALTVLKRYLRRDPEYTRYCFKMDVSKFFPSIDKDLMM